jgi:chemotaxis protein MotB
MTPSYFEKTSCSSRDRWTISYMDVLTILLIFFIAVASRLPAHETAPPAPAPAPRTSALETARSRLEGRGIDAQIEPRGLVIALPQSILFAPGDERISDAALPAVRQIADVIAELPNRVSLIGHADSAPIHNRHFRNNWELSAARGLRLLELLTERYRIPESRLSVASDGATRPRSPNDTAGGRASNRRVEIVILDEKN